MKRNFNKTPNLIFIGDRIAIEYASLSNSEFISSKTSHDLHLDDITLENYRNEKAIFIYSMGTGDYEILSKYRYHGFWDRIYYDIKKLKQYGKVIYLIPNIESNIKSNTQSNIEFNIKSGFSLIDIDSIDKEDFQRLNSIYTSIENCIDKHEIDYVDLRTVLGENVIQEIYNLIQ